MDRLPALEIVAISGIAPTRSISSARGHAAST